MAYTSGTGSFAGVTARGDVVETDPPPVASLAVYNGVRVRESHKAGVKYADYYDAFEFTGTSEDFDRWVMFQQASGFTIYLENAVPVSDMKEVITKVNW